MTRNTAFQLLFSITIAVLIIIHLLRPDLGIDEITVILLLLAALPWLIPWFASFKPASLFKTLEFPGGFKVEFQDVQVAEQKITASMTKVEGSEAVLRPAYAEIFAKDANLALVGLRIEIEKRLRELAKQHGISERSPLMRIFHQLREMGILNDSSISGLQELILAGNAAAHGADVDPGIASWAIQSGPRILATLETKLEG